MRWTIHRTTRSLRDTGPKRNLRTPSALGELANSRSLTRLDEYPLSLTLLPRLPHPRLAPLVRNADLARHSAGIASHLQPFQQAQASPDRSAHQRNSGPSTQLLLHPSGLLGARIQSPLVARAQKLLTFVRLRVSSEVVVNLCALGCVFRTARPRRRLANRIPSIELFLEER